MKSTVSKHAKKTSSGSRLDSKNILQDRSGVAYNLRKLFVNELKDIYWAEKALLKAIPKMIKKASSEELIDALQDHLSVTEGHVSRVENVFSKIGVKAVAVKCDAMDGLIKEAGKIMDETIEGAVRDAGIISAAQKVEHYEIASYGILSAFARLLGEEECASFLQQTLNEEKQADETLSDIAESIDMEANDDEYELAGHDGMSVKTRSR